MTFTRTTSGIANHHLFTEATFTVYIEGSEDSDPAHAIDIAFWREFFAEFFAAESISFRRLGGKPHVLEMARKIINSSIPNSLCAVDSDYHQIDPVLDDERVFRTFGYGVENDLFNKSVMAGLVRSILPGIDSPQKEGERLWNFVEQTARLDRYCIIADQIASCRNTSVLNRRNPRGDLVMQSDVLPVRFRKEVVRQAIRAAKASVRTKTCAARLTSSPAFVPAHHYFFIVYHTVRRWLAGLSPVKYTLETFQAVSLGVIQNSFFNHMNGEVGYHYAHLGARQITKFRG